MSTSGTIKTTETTGTNLDALPEELRDAIATAIELLEQDTLAVRERMVAVWKKYELYWRGIQNIFWSEFARDWRTVQSEFISNPEGMIDPTTYDKVINVFRGHLESIVSAMSASIPSIAFFPQDADLAEDLETAKGFRSISEQIKRENSAELLLIKMCYTICTQSFAAIYNYYEEDEQKYGTIKDKNQPITEPTPVGETLECPDCGAPREPDGAAMGLQPQAPPSGPANLGQGPMAGPPAPNMGGPALPGMVGQDMGAGGPIDPQMESMQCPICGSTTPPIATPQMEDQVVDFADIPAGKECVEVYGPLHVSIPHYVADIKSTPFLILDLEEHIAYLRSLYPGMESKVVGSGDLEKFARWGRSYPAEYSTEPEKDLATRRHCWLRPWSFEILGETEREKIDQLKELFPEGLCAVLVNDILVDAFESDMDKHWTITKSPTSRYIHDQPLAASLAPVQELDTELTNLTVETIRYGIPQTFADTEALDFEAYGNTPIEPGSVVPAKARPGLSLDGSFFQISTATLSKEVDVFDEKLRQKGEFVVGDFPSIYGGPQTGGSKTFSEYNMSRNQAMQRLNLPYRVIVTAWTEMMEKAVRDRFKNMKTDEHYVEKQGGSSFINVWINKSRMTGKVGRVKAEASDQFPTTWIQQRGLLMELLGLALPEINAAVFHPNNVGMVAQTLGFPEFHIPGDNDRNMQLREIAELIAGAPIQAPPMLDPMSGMLVPTPPQPSIPINIELDDHIVHSQTCRLWLTSEVGQYERVNNEPGYLNVFAHFLAHEMQVRMSMMPAPASEGMPPEDVPNEEEFVEEPPNVPQDSGGQDNAPAANR